MRLNIESLLSKLIGDKYSFLTSVMLLTHCGMRQTPLNLFVFFIS